MALYKCVAKGVQPNGATWSFSQYCSSALSQAAAASAWDTAVGAYWSAASAHHAPGVNLVSTVVYSIDPATGTATAVTTTGHAAAGTGATAQLPYGSAVAVSKETVQPGRTGRGRFFLPPLVAGDLSSGLILAGTITTLVAAVKALYDSLVGASMTPVLYGLRSHIIFNLSGFHIDNKFDHQANRQNKVVGTRTSSAL